MRRSLTSWSRLPALLHLLLHLGVVGAGPAVDARLEVAARASDHALVHVEDATDPPCGSEHHHQLCLIRALHSMDAPPEGTSTPLTLDLLLSRPLPAAVDVPTAQTLLSALGPRAPPAA